MRDWTRTKVIEALGPSTPFFLLDDILPFLNLSDAVLPPQEINELPAVVDGADGEPDVLPSRDEDDSAGAHDSTDALANKIQAVRAWSDHFDWKCRRNSIEIANQGKAQERIDDWAGALSKLRELGEACDSAHHAARVRLRDAERVLSRNDSDTALQARPRVHPPETPPSIDAAASGALHDVAVERDRLTAIQKLADRTNRALLLYETKLAVLRDAVRHKEEAGDLIDFYPNTRDELPASSEIARNHFWNLYDLIREKPHISGEWRSLADMYRAIVRAAGARSKDTIDQEAKNVRQLFRVGNDWQRPTVEATTSHVLKLGEEYDRSQPEDTLY